MAEAQVPSGDAPRTQVHIVDDGELEDVRRALTSLGVSFACGAELPEEGEIPLLVTSAARARGMRAGAGGERRHHLHLVVSDADGDSLHGIPCDFLLRRPVTKEVLRLLAERASYVGPERRRSTRVAMGVPVNLHLEDAVHEAILAQLSIGGCGLVASRAFDEGTALRVELPKELTRPRHLHIAGRVLSARATTTADGHTFDISVVFDALRLSDRVTLRALMAGQPIDFRPRSEGGAQAGPSRAPRRGTRRTPGRRFGVARVVIGRDLSDAGMRIELDPTLHEGDALQLALYGSTGRDALLLRGIAERDPQEEAWRVRFVDLGEQASRGIGALREECTRDGPGFVIAEILEG